MGKMWTENEIKLLKENYKNMNDVELALLIGRSISAVKSKRKDIGLLSDNPFHKKYDFQDVKNVFDKKGYILLSDESEYINAAKSTLRYICPNHKDKGEQKISLGHLLDGRGCRYCGRENTIRGHMIELDKESDKKLCESKGFIYIDTIRENGNIFIQFICSKHEELGLQTMSRYNMQRDIKGCQYCLGKNLPEWYVLDKARQVNPNIILLEPYVNLTTRMDCLCIKHNIHTHKSMQEILKGQGCVMCGREKVSAFNTISQDEVQERISVQNPHIKLLQYKGAQNPAFCFCNKHQVEFTKTLNYLYNNETGCNFCYTENQRKRQGMGINEFKNRLAEVHPEIVVLGEYINNSTPIKLYCTKHNYHFESTPATILTRLRCCEKGRLTYKEESVCRLLEKWGYAIKRQMEFEDCVDQRSLLFDAYLIDFGVALEYQGEQHNYPVTFGGESFEEALIRFEYTKKHDKIKKDYCKKHNIPLIEIWYYEYEDLEHYLFDKLKKIGILQEICA